jgi:hypothetical protein
MLRMKARVYIETSVISYLASRPSRDLIVAAHQEITREWWAGRRDAFTISVSTLVVDEAARGDEQAAQLRLNVLAGITSVVIEPEAVTVAEALVSRGALPAKARADALHVALAAIWKADYLLTWNCTHIANGETLPLVEATLRDLGYVPPRILTPLEMMGTN